MKTQQQIIEQHEALHGTNEGQAAAHTVKYLTRHTAAYAYRFEDLHMRQRFPITLHNSDTCRGGLSDLVIKEKKVAKNTGLVACTDPKALEAKGVTFKHCKLCH